MYLWNIFKTLIYLEFCFKRCLSEPNAETLPDSRIGVELNINSTKSTDSYDYTKNFLFKVFTPRKNYGFSAVKYGGSCCKPENTLWEAKDINGFAKKVTHYTYFVGPHTEVVISLFNGNKLKYVEFKDFGWSKFDLSKTHPMTININTTLQTFANYSYPDGEHTILIPKPGFIFSGIVEGKNSCCKTESVIWNTDNPSEYSNKIIRDGRKIRNIPQNITIFHVNGSITHFSKSNNRWIKQPSKVDVIKSIESPYIEDTSLSLPPSTALKRIDMQPKYNAENNGIHLDLSKKSKNEQFEIISNGNIETYIPKLKFIFISVKAKANKSKNSPCITLWDGSERCEYSKKVVVDTNYISSLVIIHLTSRDVIKFYMDESNLWTRLNPNTRTSVAIDVKSSNKYIVYNVYGNIRVRSYIARRDFIFKEILFGGVSVWKCEEPNDMSLRVDLSTFHFPASTIKIHSINGRVRNFYQFDEGFPWNETNHIPSSVASFPNPPKKPYFEPNDYPTDTLTGKYTLDHTAFGINKMHDISDFMLSRPIDHINGYKDIGINGFGMKMVDILMWTDNTVYRRLSANIPLLGRPLFSLIHRNNRWNCGFCKDVKSLQTRLKFTNI